MADRDLSGNTSQNGRAIQSPLRHVQGCSSFDCFVQSCHAVRFLIKRNSIIIMSSSSSSSSTADRYPFVPLTVANLNDLLDDMETAVESLDVNSPEDAIEIHETVVDSYDLTNQTRETRQKLLNVFKQFYSDRQLVLPAHTRQLIEVPNLPPAVIAPGEVVKLDIFVSESPAASAPTQ
jgi:hypothetical protein